MEAKKENKEIKEPKQRFFKNKYFNLVFYSILNLLLLIWVQNLLLILVFVIIYDFFISEKVNWTFWKKRGAPKTKLVEWIDAIVFAGIAALIIRTLLIEAYTIPTSSMEKTLKVGDYLFVSKYHYGPRLPITPLAIPFTHHTLPLTKYTPAFIDWIQLPYKRLAGLTKIKNNDIVVFNFPVGDTVAAYMQAQSYYELCRQFGRENVLNDILINPYNGEKQVGSFGKILVRPMDKMDNYIKRCVAIGGDTIRVIDGQVYINDKPQVPIGEVQYKYAIVTDGSQINPLVYKRLKISQEDLDNSKNIDPNIVIFMPELSKFDLSNLMVLPLTDSDFEQFKTLPELLFIKKIIKPKNYKEPYIYPHTATKYEISDTLVNLMKSNDEKLATYFAANRNTIFSTDDFLEIIFKNTSDSNIIYNVKNYLDLSQKGTYAWNEDNFGPLLIPKKGQTISLTVETLPAYERLISVYEHNKLEIKNGKIFINDTESDKYTFKQDYFFMMGDNRHNSADSRFWGMVPEDHIVGTPLFIWLSLDKDRAFISKIRWNRFFKGTRNI
jgi:signal peptidase I